MIVVVPVDPPRAECVSPRFELPDELEADATALYEAAVTDVLRTVTESGGKLLVNYRDDETLPAVDGSDEPLEACRSLVADGVPDVDAVRFERQVGSTVSARIGNTVTHLLEEEDEGIVGVLDPLAPLVRRSEVDGAAMTARRHEVALGSDGAGGVYLSVFADTIDFADAYVPPALSTLAERARAAERSIGFGPIVPRIATEAGLAATIATIDARRAAANPVPEATAAVVEERNLETPDGVTVIRA